MDAVYRSAAPLADKGSATLVVTCTSNAYVPVVREFLERHRGLPEGTYDWLAVPGGPHFLLLTEYLPKFAWAGHRWVKFLVERHRLKRAILVTHEDCAWRDDDRMLPALLHRLGVGAAASATPRDRDLEALRTMARSVRELLPSIAVEAYFAGTTAAGPVEFVPVV